MREVQEIIFPKGTKHQPSSQEGNLRKKARQKAGREGEARHSPITAGKGPGFTWNPRIPVRAPRPLRKTLTSRSPAGSPTVLKVRKSPLVARCSILPFLARRVFAPRPFHGGGPLKPQSCNIIRLHVQFSYEVSEIKAIHHRLGTEFGKPAPAQPYLWEAETIQTSDGTGASGRQRSVELEINVGARAEGGARGSGWPNLDHLPGPRRARVPPPTCITCT